MENVPLRAEARTEERDAIRKQFRDQFNRELAERKTWEEIYLGQLEERKTELKAAETKPPTQSEGQSVEQVDIEQDVQEDDPSARLFDELIDREIRQHKFLAEVAEIRIRQDKLFERFEEQRKKAEEKAFYRSRRREE
ncbi:hypothetical protein LI328DRAFT_157022 [Trichoderma asperelloides]|nr:hypothetical protein LI328DRAFT_157022 [Trichoderma asperelloides]